jgi:hypothetical protein
MLLGDERDHKNFIEGVESSDYGVLILSTNTIQSIYANEELDLMYIKHLNGTMSIFPLYYNIRAEELPPRYTWLNELVYKEIQTSTDVRSACNHIICRMLLDELEKHEIDSLDKLITLTKRTQIDRFISSITSAYLDIDGGNYNARIALLYSACLYIEKKYDISKLPLYYTKGFQRLFNETKLSIPVNLRELLIIERLYLLLVNSTVLRNIV